MAISITHGTTIIPLTAYPYPKDKIIMNKIKIIDNDRITPDNKTLDIPNSARIVINKASLAVFVVSYVFWYMIKRKFDTVKNDTAIIKRALYPNNTA